MTRILCWIAVFVLVCTLVVLAVDTIKGGLIARPPTPTVVDK